VQSVSLEQALNTKEWSETQERGDVT
jgi:hypothetical protein